MWSSVTLGSIAFTDRKNFAPFCLSLAVWTITVSPSSWSAFSFAHRSRGCSKLPLSCGPHVQTRLDFCTVCFGKWLSVVGINDMIMAAALSIDWKCILSLSSIIQSKRCIDGSLQLSFFDFGVHKCGVCRHLLVEMYQLVLYWCTDDDDGDDVKMHTEISFLIPGTYCPVDQPSNQVGGGRSLMGNESYYRYRSGAIMLALLCAREICANKSREWPVKGNFLPAEMNCQITSVCGPTLVSSFAATPRVRWHFHWTRCGLWVKQYLLVLLVLCLSNFTLAV